MKNETKPTKKDGLNIVPIADRIVVRVGKPKEKTASGIIIPDTNKQEKPEEGIVVAVGAGRYDGDEQVPMTVQVGDRVLFSKYGPDEIKIDGEEYLIMREDSVLAIIK